MSQPTASTDVTRLDQAVIDAGRALTEAHLADAGPATVAPLRAALEQAIAARWPR